MLFKEELKPSLKFANTKISELYHLLEVMRQENIFIELQATLEREPKLTWVLRTMLSLCQMQIKKILLMQSLEPVSVPLGKDVWLSPQLSSLESLLNGSQK
jgi:hypothetical protein